MSITVGELKMMNMIIPRMVQTDDFEVVRTEEGLMMRFPILGSDPEGWFDLLDIKQKGLINIINLDVIKQRLLDNYPEMRECFFSLWSYMQEHSSLA